MDRQYDAFISYKHGSILPFAERLARSLRTYATGMFSRPRSVFRDEDHLVPSASLPDLIRRALENSRYLVLLASPEAAGSPWVHRELQYWCEDLRRADRIIVVLLDGSLEVDSATATIDWAHTNALPSMLRDHVADVPLYVDLRGLRSAGDLDARNPTFESAVARIVARVRDADVHDLIGYEIRQHRRRVRIRNAAIALLASLTLIAAAVAFYANLQRVEQQRATRLALANAIAAQVRPDATRSQDERRALLARQAYLFAERSGRPLPDSVNTALQNALSIDYFTSSRSVGPGFASHLAASADGRVVAVDNSSRVVRVWKSGNPGDVVRLDAGMDTQIDSIAVSSSGRWLAAGLQANGSIQVWDLAQQVGDAAPVSLEGHTARVNSLAFNSEETRLASASDDGTVRIWSVQQPKQKPQVLQHMGEVQVARFVSNRVLTATAESAIETWSQDGTSLARTSALSGNRVGIIEFDRLGRFVAISTFGKGDISLYDLRQPYARPTLLKSPTGEVKALAFAPAGGQIAAGTSEGDIIVWNIGAVAPVARIPSGHNTDVTNIVYVDGPAIISAGEQDGEIRTRYLRPTPISGFTLSSVRAARFGADDDHLNVLDHKDGHPEIRIPSTEQIVQLAAHPEEVSASSWYAAKRGFVSMNFKTRTGALWPSTAAHGQPQRFRFPNYPGDAASAVATDDNGGAVVWVDSYDESVWAVNVGTSSPTAVALRTGAIKPTIRSSIDADGNPTRVLSNGVRDWSPPLAISVDGRRVAVGGGDGSVRVWMLSAANEPPDTLSGFGGWPLTLAFSGDGKLLAVAGTERTVQVWDLAKRRIAYTLRGHESRIDALAFAPNQPLLASGGPDRTVRIWNLTGREPVPLVFVEREEIDSLDFSPSGRQLLVGADHAAHLRTVSAPTVAERICSVVSRNLSLQEWRGFIGPDFAYERTCGNLPIHQSFLESARDLARIGALDQARALIAQAARLDAKNTSGWSAEVDRAVAEGMLQKAEELARTGDVDSGTALMQQALSRGAHLGSEPRAYAQQLAADGLFSQAEQLTRAGDAEKKLALLNRSIEMLPRAGALAARGRVRADRGETDKALADLDRALSLDGLRWDIQALRAQVLLRKDDWSGALEASSRALEMVRDVRRKLRSTPANKLGVADPTFAEALRASITEATLLSMRAYASLRVGDYLGAITDYSMVLTDDPKNEQALLGRGITYSYKGDCEKAIRDLTAVLSLNPNNSLALQYRAKCLSGIRNHDERMRGLEATGARKESAHR